jgi:translation initiation factor 6
MERTITLAGDPNIGVFSRVLGNIAIIPPDAPEDYKQALISALNVELVEMTVQGSAIIGSLLTGNNRGIIMSGLATESEIETLEKFRKVFLLKESMNAAGNVIMANDTFAAVHEDMPSDLAHEIG